MAETLSRMSGSKPSKNVNNGTEITSRRREKNTNETSFKTAGQPLNEKHPSLMGGAFWGGGLVSLSFFFFFFFFF
jgi:hypothetical protein